MISIKTIELPKSKYKLKCPYSMTPSRIVIQNTANDASAENEIKYMQKSSKECSFHFAVDDESIINGLPLDRNGWHAGDGGGKGNREGIAIEICYSKSGGERFRKAQENAAELTAYLLDKYNWGLDKVTKHEDYANKHCPHRTLDEYGWKYFTNLVESFRFKPCKQLNTEQNRDNNISVIYKVWDDVKNKWLPDVTDNNDFAGIFGHDVCAIYASLSRENIKYAVHIRGAKWLPEVLNRNDYAGIFNKPIDAIILRTDTENAIHYQVHLRRKNKWLPEISGCNYDDKENGYAGILGEEIDGIKIWLD